MHILQVSSFIHLLRQKKKMNTLPKINHEEVCEVLRNFDLSIFDVEMKTSDDRIDRTDTLTTLEAVSIPTSSCMEPTVADESNNFFRAEYNKTPPNRCSVEPVNAECNDDQAIMFPPVQFLQSDRGQLLEDKLRGTLKKKKAAQEAINKVEEVSRLCLKASTYCSSIFSTIQTLDQTQKELQKCVTELTFIKRNLKLQLRRNDLI